MSLPTSRNTTYAALSQVLSADLNAIQDGIVLHNRQIVGPRAALDRLLARVAETQAALSTAHLYSVGWGGVSVDGPISVTGGGIIAQVVGGELLYYDADGDELLTIFSDGDASDPRWDLICVKLEPADGAVTLTKQIVEGTPDPSPVEPSVPAGYLRWAAVRIPANQTSGSAELDSVTDLRDYRLPFGVSIVDVFPASMQFARASGFWTENERSITADGSAARTAYAFPGLQHVRGRLIGIGLIAETLAGAAVAGSAKIQRGNVVSGSFTDLQTVTASLITADGTGKYRARDLLADTPLWLNGYAAGSANLESAPTANLTHLALAYLSGSDKADSVYMARFIIAGA